MSALPAFLIPALTGFALSKLTGQSTKSSLRNALIGGITGGITSGFGASTSQAGTAVTGANVSGAERVALGIGDPKISGGSGIMDTIKSGFGKEAFTLGGKSFSYGDVAKVGIPAAALYKSFSDAAKAPKAVPFYGANVNYADPRIYSQVGPQKFKVGQYDDAGNMTVADMPGADTYVPPEAVYASGAVPAMPYAMGKQMITASQGGLATLKGIKKYNIGGQVLPSKMTHNEDDVNNYVRSNGHVVDISPMANKDEDTVLAQLADGEFVTRADGVLGAGILAGASPSNIKDMRKKGAKYFYDQQAKFKRIFDLLQKDKRVS
jgi:hypothetical protein